MPYTNFDTSGLTAYVEQNRDLLIKNIIFGKGTRSRISIQTGIKCSEHLHDFDVEPVFGDGSDCGFDPDGTAAITERLITVVPLKVQMEICPKNLLCTYAEYLVRMNATAESLPYEQYLLDGVIDKINRKIETLIWVGDSSASDPIDGFITLAAASVTGSTGVVGESIASGATAYEGILQVYNSLTENTLERGAEIYVSPAIFRAFMSDMVALNLYHYNPGNENFNEFLLPGTDVKVVKTAGLSGNLNILGTYPRNLYYGTDGENDAEVIDLWYSRDNRTWRLEALWNSGVQIAYLDEVVLGTFAATPAATAGLASIAKCVCAADAPADDDENLG